ncbi:hypothetical protein, partial [Streptomyces sp. NPDC048256]|uniref:hypothetical protein n=1 Tax=Streptomyces sp. NPDC048256 TaxID=3154613 RepID=UPI0033C22B06
PPPLPTLSLPAAPHTRGDTPAATHPDQELTINTPTLPGHVLSGLAAGTSALAHAPWWIVLPLLLPTTAAAITTLVTTCTTARTEAMRRRHEDAFLGKAAEAADYTAGLDHIARIRQSAAPPTDPAAQTQQPAEPPTPPP